MTTYFVKTGGSDGANGLSDANAWATIGKVNGFTFSAGDTIQFNRGDTFADATLTPPISGSSGSPITFQAYGTGAKPIIGDNTLNNSLIISAKSFLDFDNLEINGTTGTNAAHDMVSIDGVCDSINFTDCDLNAGGAGTLGHTIEIGDKTNAVTNLIFTTCTIDANNANGANIRDDCGNITFDTCSFVDTNGRDDNEILQLNGTGITGVICNDCSFDGSSFPTAGDFLVDLVGGEDTIFNRCTFDTTRSDCVHIAAIYPPASIGATFNDCDFQNSNNGWFLIREESTATFNRCNFHDQAAGRGGFVQGKKNHSDGTVAVFNACSFLIEAGATTTEMIEIDNQSAVTFDNCSLVMRNGAGSGLRVIQLKDTLNTNPTAGSFKFRNSIIDGDNVTLIDETSANANYTFNFQNNLFERGDQTTAWFSFQDETTCTDENDVGATAPLQLTNNISGDPLFDSEDDTAADFLILGTGSPGIGAGNNTFNPASDLAGISYSDPPNIGARAKELAEALARVRKRIMHLGYVPVDDTIYVPFETVDGDGASVTITGLAATDIEIYKNGGTNQRSSDAGYTLLDTDGVDFDGITGIHGVSIDLSDNTDAGFYATGAKYWIVLSSITVSAQTVNTILATFTIGPGPSNVIQVSGDATAADNIEADYDGTGYDKSNSTVGTVTSVAGLANAAVDAIFKRDLSAITGEAARSLLNAVRFLRNKWSISGSTLTVTKEDDSTTAWTATITTDAAADPITGNDPT